ncbi:MAG: hypothetical protein ACREPM_23645 [Gemmatimonadaceae bacterium]
MAKDQGKENKSNAQKAADKHEDSVIKDLKEPTRDADKIKGGVAKKRTD